jgi:type V secretory pathway adhesin AidA
MALLAVLLVACSGQGVTSTSQAQTPSPTATATAPTPTPTLTPVAVSSIPTATSYYQAVKAQNYERAYTYLDSNATTTDGKKLTKSVFLQLAQLEESNYGPINNIDLFSGSTDGTQIIATIDRNGGMRYHSHLTMKKEGSLWKIISLDRV